MSLMTAVIPHGRPFTVADLEGTPDDGNRFLQDGAYAQVAHVGDESHTAQRPYPVTITPARLLDGTRP